MRQPFISMQKATVDALFSLTASKNFGKTLYENVFFNFVFDFFTGSFISHMRLRRPRTFNIL